MLTCGPSPSSIDYLNIIDIEATPLMIQWRFVNSVLSSRSIDEVIINRFAEAITGISVNGHESRGFLMA